LRETDRGLLLGTYSGRGGQYVNPENNRLVETERDEIKYRFLRGQIDILLCFITGSASIRHWVIEHPSSSSNCTEKLPDFVSGKLLPDQSSPISGTKNWRHNRD